MTLEPVTTLERLQNQKTNCTATKHGPGKTHIGEAEHRGNGQGEICSSHAESDVDSCTCLVLAINICHGETR